MHAGAVERIVAVDHPQKARALLEGLGAEARHFLQRGAAAQRPLGVAKGDDIGGQQFADAGNAGEQRRRGRVDIDADRVDAIFHHGVERARQLRFGDIVLILTDADGFGVDLHEFRERILQTPRDRGGAAQRHVEIGQFARGVFGSRIDRGARFRHHDLGQFQFGILGDQFAGQFVGLARGRAIADRDEFDLVLAREPAQQAQGFVPAPLRLMRINSRGGDDLAGLVHDGDLDAGAKPGIESERRACSGGRGEQESAQIARRRR